jgi:hypothetical protein
MAGPSRRLRQGPAGSTMLFLTNVAVAAIRPGCEIIRSNRTVLPLGPYLQILSVEVFRPKAWCAL